MHSTGPPPRSTLHTEYTAGSQLDLSSDQEVAGEGRKVSGGQRPSRPSLYRAVGRSPKPRFTPLTLPFTWSLGGKMQPTHQTAPSTSRVSDPTPQSGSTGQRPGTKQWSKAGREKQDKAVRVQHPSTFGLARPVSRAARRTPERAPGTDWLFSFGSYWLGPGSAAARASPSTQMVSRPALGRVDNPGPGQKVLKEAGLLASVPIFRVQHPSAFGFAHPVSRAAL